MCRLGAHIETLTSVHAVLGFVVVVVLWLVVITELYCGNGGDGHDVYAERVSE